MSGYGLLFHQDKDTGLIGGQAWVERICGAGDELIKFIGSLGGERLVDLVLAKLLRDIDPFALAIAIRIIPVQDCEFILCFLVEREVHFNAGCIRQFLDDLTVVEDIHIQAHHVGGTNGQWSRQFLGTHTMNGGLIVTQVVVSQLDTERPEDAVAVQVDQFAASQRDDEG